MKTAIAIGLIILGIVSLTRYPNLGVNGFETLGALMGCALITFLPAFLLIRSDNQSKTK